MKAWMATAAALALLTGLSTANAQNAPASNAKIDKTTDMTMEQSAAPKANASHKTRIHQSMRMRHHARETTGFGGHADTIGSGRNDPSIHQSRGDRDSRDYPKQH
jgi:hypothetical protein